MDTNQGPDTFRELIKFLECDEHCKHERLVERINSVCEWYESMRRNCMEQVAKDDVELQRYLSDVEDLAVKGWYHAAKQCSRNDDLRRRIEKMSGELRNSRKEVPRMDVAHQHDDPAEQDAEQIRGELRASEKENTLLDENIDALEGEKSEAIQELASMATRMESLFDHFDQGAPRDTLPPSTLKTPSVATPSPNDDVSTHNTPWISPSPTPVSSASRSSALSLLTEPGSLLETHSASYPPPLPPATEAAQRADEQKTHMLSEVEAVLWIQESKDREYLVQRPGPPWHTTRSTRPPPPPEKRTPRYIYIPLTRNFTIPHFKPAMVSLTFPSRPEVYHFPGCATRDEVLAIVRQGRRYANRGSGEDVNVLRVRTHRLEWELKNAVRKVIGQKRWERVAGEKWATEGRGDTYIVSKRDLYFHDADEEPAELPGADDDAEVSFMSDEEVHDPYDYEYPYAFSDSDASHLSSYLDWDDEPQLRGGASPSPPSPFPSLSTSPSPLSSSSPSSQTPRPLAHHRPPTTSPPPFPFPTHPHHCPSVSHARILQLQVAAHARTISRLEGILQDTEDTVQWQDEQLAQAYTYIAELKQKLHERNADVYAAGRRADLATAETKVLQDRLLEIHEQVVRFGNELDERVGPVMARYRDWEGSECGSDSVVEIRGGGEGVATRSGSIASEEGNRGGCEGRRESGIGNKICREDVLISPLASPESSGAEESPDDMSRSCEIEHGEGVSRKKAGWKESNADFGVSTRPRADSISEDRGYNPVLELPPTAVEPMFPTNASGTSHSDLQTHQPAPPPSGPNNRREEHPSPTRTSPASPAPSSPGTKLPATPSSPASQTPDAGWGTWRHRKGEGCETWMVPSSLDPERDACGFCGLPFLQVSWEKWGEERGPCADG